MEGLVVCSANYVPLTPMSFLERAAFVYGEKVSMIYGDTKYSWKEMHGRCIKLASALSLLGIQRGHTVAAIAPNIPALYELFFGVPMAGAVLSTFNPMLSATILATKLEHLEAKIIFVDWQSIDVVLDSFSMLPSEKCKPSIVVLIQESNSESPDCLREEAPMKNVLTYDSLVSMGQADFKMVQPKDECDPISMSFTSGSTGEPKGVVYSHRAAYLGSIAQIFRAEMRHPPVFLWTVDMFRCSGWCFPWTMAALGGTNICLRDLTGKAILDAIFLHKVTYFCGAPAILKKITDVPGADQRKLPHSVNVTVAGAMPAPEVLMKLEVLGFNVNRAYGMTEAVGIVTSRPFTASHEDVSKSNGGEEVTKLIRIREGIHNLMMEGVDVKDPATMESVPADGKTMGEIVFRSNTMMLGYMKNAQATREAFESGWYRTRDIGVRLPNGEIELKDRAIDMIKCQGIPVSTLEIEAVLIRHPGVLEAGVVGRPDDLYGETPCAFLKLKEEFLSVTEEDIVAFCSCHLPSHMIPQSVIFGDLPISSTGKIQKFALKEKARAL